jgi:AcrR family transcriptional regulator
MAAERRPRRPSRGRVAARRQILSGAAELFMERGYDATSVREIGEHLDISQSSLYYHAKNKPQILVDLNTEFMSGLVEAIDRIAARDASSVEKLTEVIHELLSAIAENQAVVTVVLHERRSLPPESAAEIQALRDRVDAAIDSIIQAGIDDETFASVDPHMARLALTGMTNWAYTWYQPSGPLSADEISRSFASFLLDGIRKG